MIKMSLICLLTCSSSLALANPASDYLTDLENFQTKSFSLKIERGRLESAQDNRLAKQLFWTPTVSVSVGKRKTSLNSQIISDVDYAEADASLNLFRGGSDMASLNQAEALEKARQFALRNEEIQADISGSNLIFKSLFLKESLRIQQELQNLKEESLKIAKDRYSLGKTPLQEVTKSEVDLSQQKNRVRTAALALAENDVAIQSLQVQSLQTTLWPFSETEMWLPLSTKELETAKMPSLEKKYWDLKSTEYGWKATQRSHWPTLDFTFQYQEFPLKERDSKQWTSLLELKIPLWSRYETTAAASSAYAIFLQSETEYSQTQLSENIKRDFLGQKISVARQNLAESRTTSDKSRRLYQELLHSFRIGRLSVNDLFLEQNRLLESESNLAESLLTYHQVVVEVCALQGLRMQKCMRR